jgi:Flp pilus assembly protein TadG
MVELGLAISVLLLLVLGVIEFSRHYHTRLTVRHHVAEAGRLAATGRTLIDPDTGEPMSRAESVRYYIQTSASTLPVILDSVVLDPPDGGRPGDFVQIRARFRFAFDTSPLVRALAPRTLTFSVASLVKNEPRF